MDSHTLVRRFTDLCNAHRFDQAGEVIAENYRQHNPMVEDGLAGIRTGFEQFVAVFPDLGATLEAVVAQGDLVVARFTWRGTHMGEFMGIAATRRTAVWASMDWWRVEDGLLAEHWDVVDWAGLTAQLTAPSAPSSEQARP